MPRVSRNDSANKTIFYTSLISWQSVNKASQIFYCWRSHLIGRERYMIWGWRQSVSFEISKSNDLSDLVFIAIFYNIRLAKQTHHLLICLVFFLITSVWLNTGGQHGISTTTTWMKNRAEFRLWEWVYVLFNALHWLSCGNLGVRYNARRQLVWAFYSEYCINQYLAQYILKVEI